MAQHADVSYSPARRRTTSSAPAEVASLNEWAFAAEVKSWWDAEFRRQPGWQLDRCEVEDVPEGGHQRSDLTVLGGGVVRLAGELRLPDHPTASPWDPDNLSFAINKAHQHGARWAFTSDGVTFLLIDTDRIGPPHTRVVEMINMVHFENRRELDSAVFLASVEDAWTKRLHEIVRYVLGLARPAGLAPDEAFINSLRALLAAPVAAIRHEMNQRRVGDPVFAQNLVRWMVDEQGWSHDPTRWEAEVERAARLVTYVFSTRLLFYGALRHHHLELSKLELPTVSASIARPLFEAFFREGRVRSRDYETLFSWDFSSELALLADSAIAGWQRVLAHLSIFDLTAGFDILGKVFERLIDPHERYAWGQHYTKPDVVDLMLSFAIPDGKGAILDPAAGGGTFLVRAYARKKALDPSQTHQALLSEIYGIDVSAFAANVATVNLAVRHLALEDNYPRVAARSFFQVQPARSFMSLPVPQGVRLGSASAPIAVDTVSAIACNPPYVRVHELGEERRREATAILGHGFRVPIPSQIHKNSNYHLYFWLHAAQFLEKSARLAFITAGEWLDSDYGVVLQQWLLDNFRLICFVESLAEPWFSEARVGTVVIIAELCASEEARDENQVRFVTLRKTLRELYGQAGNDRDHFANVDVIRDQLLALGGTGESPNYDWTVIRQQDLRRLGTEAPA